MPLPLEFASKLDAVYLVVRALEEEMYIIPSLFGVGSAGSTIGPLWICGVGVCLGGRDRCAVGAVWMRVVWGVRRPLFGIVGMVMWHRFLD